MFKILLSYFLVGMIFIPFVMVALFIRRNGGSSIIEHSIVFVGFVAAIAASGAFLQKECK
jgi:hypothetical protein